MDYGNRKIQFLNITYLTEFRKDGHPSKNREPGTPALAPQDCSHWCLPGVPDIEKGKNKKKKKKKKSCDLVIDNIISTLTAVQKICIGY